jgi:hypothetical protein
MVPLGELAEPDVLGDLLESPLWVANLPSLG